MVLPSGFVMGYINLSLRYKNSICQRKGETFQKIQVKQKLYAKALSENAGWLSEDVGDSQYSEMILLQGVPSSSLQIMIHEGVLGKKHLFKQTLRVDYAYSEIIFMLLWSIKQYLKGTKMEERSLSNLFRLQWDVIHTEQWKRNNKGEDIQWK